MSASHPNPASASSSESFVTRVGNWLGSYGGLLALLAFGAMLLVPVDLEPAARRLAAVTALMVVLWLTQAAPLAATALIPIAAFPLLGLGTAKEVSAQYISPNILLFLGGFVIALGIERWGLHRRIALVIVSRVGTGLKRVVLGFMLATGFLSMWISNTAATLMMLPIGLAFVSSLREMLGERTDVTPEEQAETETIIDRFATVLLLAIAYSSSIGGLCTLVGTLPNVVYADIWRNAFPEKPEIAAGQWMFAVLPVGAVLMSLAWLVLTVTLKELPRRFAPDRTFFRDRLKALGPMTGPEWTMLAIFTITAMLWIFRKPIDLLGITVPAWGPLVTEWLIYLQVEPEVASKAIHDSTVAMLMAIVMFFIPVRASAPGRSSTGDEHSSSRWERLMTWEVAERLPWGVLLLVGGGLAVAEGFRTTGLAAWTGTTFSTAVADWSSGGIVAGLCLLVTFLTELTSNTATTTTLLPILIGMAESLELEPALVMIPATLSATCAFMLPVATPPNAIVFGSGRVPLSKMAGYGFILNLLAAGLMSVASLYWLGPQLGM